MKALNDIRKIIGSGDLPKGAEQLLELLDGDPRAEMLAQAARAQLATYNQAVSDGKNDLITKDQATVGQTRSTRAILQVIDKYENGEFDADLDFAESNNKKKNKSLTWGIWAAVALVGVFMVFKLAGRTPKTQACPDFGSKSLKILILPIFQTGEASAAREELEIQAELNQLLKKNPTLDAVAAVKNSFNPAKQPYPTDDDSKRILQGCSAQMLVYGRTSSTSGEKSLDIEYSVLSGASGDTALLTKSYRESATAIAQYLFLVVCNQRGVPIAAAELEKMSEMVGVPPSGDASDTGAKPVTTSPNKAAFYVELGDAWAKSKHPAKAVSSYSTAIELQPSRTDALVKRGMVNYEQKNYTAAARDLEAAPIPKSESQEMQFLKIRTDSYIKTGQFDKANKDLKLMRSKSNNDGAWIEAQKKTVEAGLATEQANAKDAEQLAKKQPKNAELALDAARKTSALGKNKMAEYYADKVLVQEPANAEALGIKITANLLAGDTAKAVKIIEKAKKEGFSVKNVLEKAPIVRPLLLPEKNE